MAARFDSYGARSLVGEGLAPPAGFAPCRLVGGISPPAGGEPLLERSKRGEKIAGGGHVGPYGPPMLSTPGPPFTGELGTKTRRKCTGAGWPLTHRRSPARCHCAAKPENCPCYPLRRASPGVPPWCGGYRMVQFSPCVVFSPSPVPRGDIQ